MRNSLAILQFYSYRVQRLKIQPKNLTFINCIINGTRMVCYIFVSWVMLGMLQIFLHNYYNWCVTNHKKVKIVLIIFIIIFLWKKKKSFCFSIFSLYKMSWNYTFKCSHWLVAEKRAINKGDPGIKKGIYKNNLLLKKAIF